MAAYRSVLAEPPAELEERHQLFLQEGNFKGRGSSGRFQTNGNRFAKEMKIKELEAETAARMDLVIWIRPRLSQNREPPFFSTTEAHQCKAVFGCVPGVAHPATSHACQTRRPLLSLNR